MKNNLLKYYITAFYLCSTFVLFAQDPGTGGGIENDGTGDTTPGAPIDDYIIPLAILGLILVFVRFKSLQSKKIKRQNRRY